MTNQEERAAERAADLVTPLLQRQEWRQARKYRAWLLEPVSDRLAILKIDDEVVPEAAAPTKRLPECNLNGFTNETCGHAVVVCDAAMDRFEADGGWDCPRCNIAHYPRIGVYNVELSCDKLRTLIPGLVCLECHDAYCTGACCAHIGVEEDEYGAEVVFWSNQEYPETDSEDGAE